MRKFYLFMVLIILTACSKVEQEHEVWLKNTQNEKIYIQVDGWNNLQSRKLVFIQHGLASNMEHPSVQAAKKAFLDNGYTVVTFDSRYSMGKSDGDVMHVRLSTFEDDLATVVDWAKEQKFYYQPFALVGHSLGGASVMQYAHKHPEQVGILIPITPVVSGKLWKDACMKYMPDFCSMWQANGVYQYMDKNKVINIPYRVVEDLQDFDALTFAPMLKGQKLLVAAENDRIIDSKDIQNLAEHTDAAGQFVTIPNSGHNFETSQNQADLYQAINHFLQ